MPHLGPETLGVAEWQLVLLVFHVFFVGGWGGGPFSDWGWAPGSGLGGLGAQTVLIAAKTEGLFSEQCLPYGGSYIQDQVARVRGFCRVAGANPRSQRIFFACPHPPRGLEPSVDHGSSWFSYMPRCARFGAAWQGLSGAPGSRRSA